MATISSLRVVQPTEAQGYLVAAEQMLIGALQLGKVNPIPVFALTLLCGHSCEAALKSVLAYSGISSKRLSKSPYGHDISHLWKSAEGAGLQLPKPEPAWIEQLNRVYDKPFHLRYPLGFHGIVLPIQTQMLDGTELLVSLAASYGK